MSNNWVYLFGKLSGAIEVLITSSGDARHRVWLASRYIFMLSPDTVPESCRVDIQWIQDMLTRYPANKHYENSLDATYYRTRNVTASKIAQRIWTLYRMMETEVDEYLKRGGRHAQQ